ncbi:hypothetical protein [Flavobacterium sp. Root420]|uniref:hypothetical protein n=1 Tax=Flavobacterium sp. Root420 TaxID=1736533 RepID=UPI0007008E5E|nr:hypothetical protein [Flavobacterium sp. Root420]KQX08795.1 hypothetical protein ASC72_04400 [Flavobacterium sp. Root420]
MFIPFIIISSLLLLLIFGTKSLNKTREQQYEFLIENITNEVDLYCEQVRTFNFTIGLRNTNFLFNHCDLYITKNAIIILGFKKDSFFKQLSFPIILTNDLNYFLNKFPFAYVKKPGKIYFENGMVKIYFGEKGITKTDVVLKLKSLNENEINKIKELAEKNKWNKI